MWFITFHLGHFFWPGSIFLDILKYVFFCVDKNHDEFVSLIYRCDYEDTQSLN